MLLEHVVTVNYVLSGTIWLEVHYYSTTLKTQKDCLHSTATTHTIINNVPLGHVILKMQYYTMISTMHT